MSDSHTQVELAVQRTILALDRTQLAWVRTNFAIMSAGLALDKGMQALHGADLLEGRDWLTSGHVGGVFLSAIATLTLAWATLQYIAQAQAISSETSQVKLLNPALVLSVLVVVLGAIVSSGLVIWG